MTAGGRFRHESAAINGRPRPHPPGHSRSRAFTGVQQDSDAEGAGRATYRFEEAFNDRKVFQASSDTPARC
jgi:hypothetical protein